MRKWGGGGGGGGRLVGITCGKRESTRGWPDGLLLKSGVHLQRQLTLGNYAYLIKYGYGAMIVPKCLKCKLFLKGTTWQSLNAAPVSASEKIFNNSRKCTETTVQLKLQSNGKNRLIGLWFSNCSPVSNKEGKQSLEVEMVPRIFLKFKELNLKDVTKFCHFFNAANLWKFSANEN